MTDNRYVRRHVATLDQAVEIAKALKLVGSSYANIYDMSSLGSPYSHWLVESVVPPGNDWTVEQEEQAQAYG